MKKLGMIIVAILFFASLFSNVEIFASTRFDISGGVMSGNKADYKFNVPKEWVTYVYAENGDLPVEISGLLEIVNFYCVSDSGKNKPSLLFSLYVFTRKGYKTDYGLEEIVRGYDYVFAAYYPKNGGFTMVGDQKIYLSVLSPVKTAEKLKSLIVRSDSDLGRSTRVYVNFNNVMSVPPQIFGGVYYVPLREVCESLGCLVMWNPNGKTVTIDNSPAFFDSFQIKGAVFTDKRGLTMRVINDRVYAPTTYFTQVMKKSVEIDNAGNVYIYYK